MPKESKTKTMSGQLRHNPLGTVIDAADDQQVKPKLKIKAGKKNNKSSKDDDYDDYDVKEDFEEMPDSTSAQKILNQARQQRDEVANEDNLPKTTAQNDDSESDDNDEYDDEVGEDGEQGDDYEATDLSEAEEAVVSKFLNAGRAETRTLADIIMEKLKEKDAMASASQEELSQSDEIIPPKVMEVFTSVGKLLHHYKSGKLPKALKMLPHLKNWEHILWLTRPDEWSPAATYATTRIFASNLNGKLVQRFYNLVLLEKVRDDIRQNNKLNYYLYLALKKSLFKPAAFYKGFLLPLAQSHTCTLREATIVGSVLAKVSVPGNHSAAVLLRLVEMPYCGSTSMFIKTLLSKKYALPRRVIEALVKHFHSFETETRVLPVIWHQALLVFAQRYKFELDESQKNRLKQLLRTQQHHIMTQEVRRELFSVPAAAAAMAPNTYGGGVGSMMVQSEFGVAI